ncbi:MAG: Holliday junction resolvase RuvX [bacterium]|nr:Holliday junction resolvase RuvX [bacterium]
MRILGIDLGGRRVGVALSDPSGLIASALETVDGRDKDYLMAHIRDLVEQHQVGEVVVGRPLNTDGSVGKQAEKYAELAERLAQRLTVPVVFQDERFTTVEAHNTMKSLGESGKKRRESVDRVAAVLILQTYLDKQNAAKQRESDADW